MDTKTLISEAKARLINDYDRVILVDTFQNPVLVDRSELLSKLKQVYNGVMLEWYNEWKELESNR